MIWHALLIRPLGYKGPLNDLLSLPTVFGLALPGGPFPGRDNRFRLPQYGQKKPIAVRQSASFVLGCGRFVRSITYQSGSLQSRACINSQYHYSKPPVNGPGKGGESNASIGHEDTPHVYITDPHFTGNITHKRSGHDVLTA